MFQPIDHWVDIMHAELLMRQILMMSSWMAITLLITQTM